MADLEQTVAGLKTAIQNLATNLSQLTKQNGLKLEGLDLNALSTQILLGTVADANLLDSKTYADLQTAVVTEGNSTQAQLTAFIARRDNPHAVTAEQVDLGNLINQGFATAEEGQLGVSNKYIDPAVVKAVVDQAVADFQAGSPEDMDTLDEIAAILKDDPQVVNNLISQIGGLISIADAQAKMDAILAPAATKADTDFATVLSTAKVHSDGNIGTLADFLASLADTFKTGFEILVPFETLLVTGTGALSNGRIVYGYREASLPTPIGRIAYTAFAANQTVNQVYWLTDTREFIVVVQGLNAPTMQMSGLVVNGELMPYVKTVTNAGGTQTSFYFDGTGRTMPTAVGFPLAVKMIAVVPKVIDLPVYEADLTIGMTSAIVAGQPTYGYRPASGSFPIGAISEPNWANGAVIRAFNWFSHVRELRVTVDGDLRNDGTPTAMIGDVVLTCTWRHYDVALNRTAFVFAWKETLPVSGTVKVRVFMKQGAVVPVFRHETAIVVGNRSLNNMNFLGYRDPVSEGMGSIGSPNYKGLTAHKILFAQWNTTSRQVSVYIMGDVRADNINEIEYDGIRLNNRILFDLQTTTGIGTYTRHMFDSTGLTQPLTNGESVYLRF
jgi:hypothetical protein